MSHGITLITDKMTNVSKTHRDRLVVCFCVTMWWNEELGLAQSFPVLLLPLTLLLWTGFSRCGSLTILFSRSMSCCKVKTTTVIYWIVPVDRVSALGSGDGRNKEYLSLTFEHDLIPQFWFSCFTHVAHVQKFKLVSWAEEGWAGDHVNLNTSQVKG